MNDNSENEYSESEQASQALENTTNDILNVGSQFVHGINEGFKSSMKGKDNKGTRIPDKKTQNPSARFKENKNNELNNENKKANDKVDNKSSSSIANKTSENEKKDNFANRIKNKLFKKNDENVKSTVGKSLGSAIKKLLISNPLTLAFAFPILIALFFIFMLFTTTTSGFAAIKAPGFLCKISEPLSGKVLSQFSWRIENDQATAHKGIDILANRGEKVLSVYSGKVSSIGYDEKYGKYIIIDHGDYDGSKMTTRYASLLTDDESTSKGLDSIDLSIGDNVSKGEVIGYVGNSIYEDFDHLHFEILDDGVEISPNRLYNYENPAGSCHPVEGIDTTVEEINEYKCEEKIALKDDDQLNTYCSSGTKGKFMECLNGEYDIWNRASKNERENMIIKYCGSAGLNRTCEWCSSYIIWCLKETDMLDEGGFYRANASAASLKYSDKGTYYDSKYYGGNYTPKEGDIIFFRFSPEHSVSHVGVVVETKGNYVYTIEGNTTGSASVCSYDNPVCRNINTKHKALSNSTILGYLSW